MALKPDQDVLATDISYFVTAISGPNTTTMERGGIVTATGNAGLGSAMDSSTQVVAYVANPSGASQQPVGMLMNDFVNIDQSRQQLNPYKTEAQIGTKAVIMRKGWAVTNAIVANSATGLNMPTPAYTGPSGLLIEHSAAAGTTVHSPIQVGRFLSRVDADGYAKVYIDLA